MVQFKLLANDRINVHTEGKKFYNNKAMKEINELKAVATRLQALSEGIEDYFADMKMTTAINHLDKAIKLLQELEKGEF